MTLNQIAERIAFSLGDPLNNILKENIKFSIKNWRATLIRRDIQTNGLSTEFLQRIYLDLKKVDKADSCNFNLDKCHILRTVNPLPQYIRWKNDSTFKFIGTSDGGASTETEYEEIPYTCYNRFTSEVIRHSVINNYIYIFNNTKLKKIALQHAFVDPYQANILCEGCYTDDSDFPCPADMVTQIMSAILTGEFKIIPINEEVNVEKDSK